MKRILVFLLALTILTMSVLTVGCNNEPPTTDEPSEELCPDGTHKYTLENKCSECGALWNCTQGLELQENEDGYSVKGRGTSEATEIILPLGCNGKPVNRIESAAFANSDVTSIVIPETVKYIGNHAFDRSKLEKITLPDTLTYIDSAAFTNTPYFNNADNWENGNVLYIGKYLIATKSTLPAMYTVKNGTLAIAGSAFNGQSALTKIILPESLVSICDFAFMGCTSLEEIKYKGNEEQWSKILKWSSWSELAADFNVTCNYDEE